MTGPALDWQDILHLSHPEVAPLITGRQPADDTAVAPPTRTDTLGPGPQPASGAPQGPGWDRIRSLMGMVQSYPTRLRDELRGMGDQLLHNPMPLVESMVGTGELSGEPRVPLSALEPLREYATKASPALLKSIKQEGIRNPITIAHDPTTGRMVVDDGAHRLSAAFALGHSDIPARFIQGNVPAAVGTEAPASLLGASTAAAVLKHSGGATLDPATLAPMKGTGFAVADPAFTRSFSPENQAAAVAEWANSLALQKRLKQAGAHIGTWRDPETGVLEANVSDVVPDRGAALRLGVERQQKAIGHLVNGEYQGDVNLPTPVTPSGRLPAASPDAVMARLRPYEYPNHDFRTPIEKVLQPRPDPALQDLLEAHGLPNVAGPTSNASRVLPSRAQDLQAELGYNHDAAGGFPLPGAVWGGKVPTAATPASSLPADELTPASWALAHFTQGTRSQAGWLDNIREANPALAQHLEGQPALANKLYAKAAAHRDFVKGMPSTEQAVADAQSPAAEPLANWYRGWMPTLKAAGIPDKTAQMLTDFRSILSAQAAPEQEMDHALRAWDAAEHGEKITTSVVPNMKGRVDKVRLAAEGKPWAEQSGIKPVEPKTAPYNLANRGFTQTGAVDRHMMRYYSGSEEDLTAPQKQIIQARMAHDAHAAGMGVDEFQARIWGHQTGYGLGAGRAVGPNGGLAGEGTAGMPPEYWLKQHLASGRFDRLLTKYPGLQALAEEGAMQGEHYGEGDPNLFEH